MLLLDEPTASLDAGNRRVVVELIHAARLDGMGEWSIVWRVVVPNVSPT